MTLKTSRQHLAAMKKLSLAELENKLLEHQQLLNAIVKDSGMLLPRMLQAPALSEQCKTVLTQALKQYAEKNHHDAARLFRQAALLGHSKAQYYLGLMFLKGQGLPASAKHAYCWLLLAAKQREDAALKLVKSLQAQLADELIQQATELAADRYEAIEDRRMAVL